MDDDDDDDDDDEDDDEEEDEEEEENPSLASQVRLACEFETSIEKILIKVMGKIDEKNTGEKMTREQIGEIEKKDMGVGELLEEVHEVREGLWLLRQATQLNMEGEPW